MEEVAMFLRAGCWFCDFDQFCDFNGGDCWVFFRFEWSRLLGFCDLG
ncbi:hypothetical protein Pint_17810 [Pistacia integerrima]|uniref:Uncharacterized protein n=1 Tax=Pistacia integerrima TaxID=434235 RepID=A0ACC0YY92_9ROSI|nr:hypothetical protein Pint_17810 [Pistacia integerrima]